MSTPFFELIHQSKKSKARVGRIHTAHGVIDTPTFVPVATNGALKSVDMVHANDLGIDLMFANTYHLILHPGADVVAAAGGIHSFIGRDRPMITDSGGFQVFSLMYGGVTQELKSSGKKQIKSSVLSVTEEGVLFRSYRDGSPVFLTPESSVQAQKQIGADIIIPLDELLPFHATSSKMRSSLDRTHRWEERSLNEHLRNPLYQKMYGVVHGGLDRGLRALSARFLTEHAFDGYAIGGSLGTCSDDMVAMLVDLMPHLDPARPRHLLGIGDLCSLESCIPLGIDSFDSAHPTKCARHGLLLVDGGCIKIKQAQYKNAHVPVDSECDCMLCKNFSAAYLHHLFKAHEATAHTLASIHNIRYMVKYMARMRSAIMRDEI
ncbi:MAG: Queuine tRNA-ribosyltransferase [candidate division TM6 bacterium GW2011_GWE2_41_16]|nr:MAG: Queuine tRNA-ribosyltransferase [candidate division TM6 bacterium GW2011_GWE2_41_16]